MSHLLLNCPACRKQLTYVPLDGLTLHYRCAVHGLLILRPLVEVTAVEPTEMPLGCAHDQLAVHNAA